MVAPGPAAQRIIANLCTNVRGVLQALHMPIFTGDVTTPGQSLALTLFGKTNVIVTTLTGNTALNNFNPPDLSSANVVRILNNNTYCTITGLQAPSSPEGAMITIEHNYGSFYPIKFANNSSSSLAANRFQFTSDIFLLPGESVELKYDNTSGCWREFTGHKDYQTNIFGTGQDGNVTVSTSITLSRDMYYKNLTITSGGSISTSGYRIFVSEMLDISQAATNAIFNYQNTANNASASTGGAAPTAYGNATVGGGTAGGAGANGSSGNGAQGSQGGTTSANNGGPTPAGTAGGAGSGHTAGAACTANPTGITLPCYKFQDYFSIYGGNVFGGLGGGGGSSGGGDGTNSGGGGGSGGNGGAVVYIAARFVFRGWPNSNTSIVKAVGTTGGNGGTPTAGNTGGGSPGVGGGGGWIIFIATGFFGNSISSALDASSGAGGTPGTAHGSGTNANGAPSGYGGRVTIINTATGITTELNNTASYNANSGTTSGASYATKQAI